jgi:hypothetical protein
MAKKPFVPSHRSDLPTLEALDIPRRRPIFEPPRPADAPAPLWMRKDVPWIPGERHRSLVEILAEKEQRASG